MRNWIVYYQYLMEFTEYFLEKAKKYFYLLLIDFITVIIFLELLAFLR